MLQLLWLALWLCLWLPAVPPQAPAPPTLPARLLTLLCGVEGVETVHLTAPAADVAVGSTELPMLGTVTISELTEA